MLKKFFLFLFLLLIPLNAEATTTVVREFIGTYGKFDVLVAKEATGPLSKRLLTYGIGEDIPTFTTLEEAVTTLVNSGVSGATLYVKDNQTLQASLNIPSNIEIIPVDGAMIYLNGNTLTYNGSVTKWPLRKIFHDVSENGKVLGLTESHSRWFTVPTINGTDDGTVELNRFLESSENCILDDGLYAVKRQTNEAVVLKIPYSNFKLEGTPSAVIKFLPSVNTNNFWRMIGNSESTAGQNISYENIVLKGFTLDGSTSLTSYTESYNQNYGIYFYNERALTSNITISDMTIKNFSGGGIFINGRVQGVKVLNNRITEWYSNGVSYSGLGDITIANNNITPKANAPSFSSGIVLATDTQLSDALITNNNSSILRLLGKDVVRPILSIKVLGNIFTNQVFGSYLQDGDFGDNTLSYLTLQNCDNVKVHDNTIAMTHSETVPAISANSTLTVANDQGNANVTVNGNSSYVVPYNSPLTTIRTVALSGTGATTNMVKYIVRTQKAIGPFVLRVGTIAELNSGEWIKIKFNGIEWIQEVRGSFNATWNPSRSNRILINNNTIRYSYHVATSESNGVDLSLVDSYEINGNQIFNFDKGILINGGGDGIISKNNVNGGTSGLHLKSNITTPSRGNTLVSDNIFDGSVSDLIVEDSTWVNLTLRNNKFPHRTLSLLNNPTFSFQEESLLTDVGDASKTLISGLHTETQRWNSPLTTNRTVTLSPNAVSGAKFRLIRSAVSTGAFNFSIVSGDSIIANLTPGYWCEVIYTGNGWVVSAFGKLSL